MTASEALRLVRERHEKRRGPRECSVCRALDVIADAIGPGPCGACNGQGKRFEWTGRKWTEAPCAICKGSGRV